MPPTKRTNQPASGGPAGGRRQHPRRQRRRLPPMSVTATLCTLGNLVAGFAAMHYSLKDRGDITAMGWTPLELAAMLIFVGMFLDAIDGSLARLKRAESDLGVQIDSLADMVTFGVAPAFLTLRLINNQLAEDAFIIGPGADNVLGKIIWASAAVYVCCAALRLARFNLEKEKTDCEQHHRFQGLPTPGAAGAVAGLIALHQQLLITKFGGDVPQAFVQGVALAIPLIMLLCGMAMVSSIPYVHVTNRFVRGQRSFRYIVRLVVPLALAIWWLEETLALAFTVYALSGPLRMLIARLRRRAASGAEGGS